VSSDTWDFLMDKKPDVDWWHLIWFPHAILKQAFVLVGYAELVNYW
jgi:hypothetical protein